jgi:gliding motility-associated-like protein
LTDDCGNSTIKTQTIVVLDTISPTFTVPANDTIYKDASCAYNAAVAITGDVTNEDDNCDTSLDATFTDAVVNGDCEGKEIITRTWSLTDDCGNSTIKTQTIVVLDTISPTFTVPSNDTIYKDASCAYNAAVAITGDVTNEDDNCDTSLDATFTDVVVNGDCEGKEIITRTWTLTDDCGNSTIKTQTIVVLDTINPTFTVPANDTIYKDASCAYNAAVAITGDVTNEDDNCDTSLDATFTDAVVNGDCEGKEIITRTWTLTDDCGNSTVKTQTIIVLDTIRPTFTVPANDTICRDEVCNFDADISVTGDVLDENDNCSTGIVASFVDDNTHTVNCDTAGYIIRTWSLTDKCGNTTSKDQIIWIEPYPKVYATPETDTICNNEAVNIELSSPTVPTQPVKFRYVTIAPAGVTVTPANGTGLDRGSLHNVINNSTNDAQRVGFIITPYTRNASASEKCSGKNDTVYVWVEPLVKVNATPEIDTICSGDPTQILTVSPSKPTRPVMFRYETIVPYNVIVIPGSGNALSDSTVITDVITNSSDTAKRVIYIITPYTRKSGSEIEKCPGISDTIVVWVEPIPKIKLSPLIDTICTYLAPSISTSSVTNSLHPLRLYYEAQYNAGIVEVIHTGDTTNLIPGDFTLRDTIINHSDIAQRVMVIAYPYLSGSGNVRLCPGIPDTSYVWVSPELKIIVDTISTYIGGKNIRCFGLRNAFINLKPSGGITAFPGYNDSNLGYSWTWNTGSSNSRDINSLDIGDYSIVINDKLHCQDDSVFTITQPEVLTNQIKVVAELSCKGSDGILCANTHGGIEGYSYLWTRVPPDYTILPPPIKEDTLYSIIDGYYTLKVTDTNGCNLSVTKLINQPTAISISVFPSPTYGSNEIRCNGDSTGRIVIYNSDPARLTLAYEWVYPDGDTIRYTNNLPVNYLNDLTAGRYSLTYTDPSGCKGGQIVSMDEPLPLLINTVTISEYPGDYNVSCFGSLNGSISLESVIGGNNEPYTYNWQTISGGTISNPLLRNQTNLSAGSYSVTVSDKYNCAVTDTFELTQPDSISINAEVSASIYGGYNLNCYGDSAGYIRLDISGGVPTNYQIEWQDDSTSSNERNNLKAGRYVVTVSDGLGCQNIDTISINQPMPLQTGLPLISNHNGYAVSCHANSDGTILITPSGGTAEYHYAWEVDNSPMAPDTSYLENLTAGDYKLTITDANSCSATWSGVLNEPELLRMSIQTKNMNCTGSVPGSAKALVQGGIGPYEYEWSNGGITDSISNLYPDNYSLLVKDQNQCAVSDTITIIQNTEVQIDIQVENPISCNGLSDGVLRAIASDGVSPYNYIWQNGPSNQLYSGLKEGDYSVTVTDHEGCTGSQIIAFSDPEPLIPVFTVNNARCFGNNDGFVNLNAHGGTGSYKYYWDDLQVAGNEANNLTAGTYKLNVVDDKNCNTDTMVVIHQPAKLVISLDQQNTVAPFCPDWQNGIIGISVKGGTREYTYTWQDYQDEHDSILSNIKEDNYTITVVDAQNCSTDTTIRFKALHDNCLGIPSAFTPNYDNANDTWEVRYMTEDGTEVAFNEVYPNGEIHIYDRLGNLIFHCSGGCPEDWKGEDLHGRALPVDTYYYIIDLHNDNGDEPLRGIITIIR